jgi:hypothetical protein
MPGPPKLYRDYQLADESALASAYGRIGGGTDTKPENKAAWGYKPDLSQPDGLQSKWTVAAGTDTKPENKAAWGYKPDASQPDGLQSKWTVDTSLENKTARGYKPDASQPDGFQSRHSHAAGTDTKPENKAARGYKPDASQPDGLQSKWSFAAKHSGGHTQQLYRKSPDAEQPEKTFLRVAKVQDNKFENNLVDSLLTWSRALKQPLDIAVYKKARGDLRAFMEDGWMDGEDAAAAVSVDNNYIAPQKLSAFLNGRFQSKGTAQKSMDSIVQFFKDR